ncbi:MAG: hypothetical protein CFE21_16865 [Bacteroidetes bacterium B1(2017)]|nr:MAG: hypothetical protein CFE21_16865 [Bacteroidetes bacterium B1(2017)]
MIKLKPISNQESGATGTVEHHEIKRIKIVADEFTPEAFNDKVDRIANSLFKDIKLFVGLGFSFLLTLSLLWSGWNVKNIFKIDIFPGGHHGSIDDINASLGM